MFSVKAKPLFYLASFLFTICILTSTFSDENVRNFRELSNSELSQLTGGELTGCETCWIQAIKATQLGTGCLSWQIRYDPDCGYGGDYTDCVIGNYSQALRFMDFYEDDEYHEITRYTVYRCYYDYPYDPCGWGVKTGDLYGRDQCGS